MIVFFLKKRNSPSNLVLTWQKENKTEEVNEKE
ncbi:Hypothetical protein Minf_0354 [Methylacidiphilum infernorum V4]|uniref:Uncharacterized protein n=1 Tax=Methylacidiphilum infernorum (isolate V4) TaxID=481448 RepID=B3DYD5_METI4|nr:Hypothetical protein Minf_0354 [Methylacidiphilum infernorum V4]